ncbi:MAG: preprotein translocase subunit SecY [Phycisphaerales bacterium]
MLQAFINIFRIAELRNKILFTMGMLCIYRIGFFIPLAGINQVQMKAWAERQSGGATGNILDYVSIFTGGSLKQSTIFGLGIMPYISAAIIFQLLGTVYEPLKALNKEGPAGRQKVQEYTRYATVVLCLIQSLVYLKYFQSGDTPVVHAAYRNTFLFWVCGTLALTSGTVFLMWLGEQIDKYGIGNGISLIITAGIIAGMPTAIRMVASNFSVNSADAQYTPMTVIFLAVAFVVVVAGSIIITQGQRRIPIQQAKHTRGRRVYGGQRSYLPLRVNHGGVMPIIFASSLMIIPSMLLSYLDAAMQNPSEDASSFYLFVYGTINFLHNNFGFNSYPYTVAYIGLIYFFAYFWTTVQFQPKEMATQLRDHGSFIPGLRPGPRTADYLETVMERITYVGAGFLALIAVVPTIVSGVFEIDFMVTQFLGGTGLLIVVSVMLDFVQRIEASLLMRNYQGFLADGGGKGPKIRGARGS